MSSSNIPSSGDTPERGSARGSQEEFRLDDGTTPRQPENPFAGAQFPLHAGAWLPSAASQNYGAQATAKRNNTARAMSYVAHHSQTRLVWLDGSGLDATGLHD